MRAIFHALMEPDMKASILLFLPLTAVLGCAAVRTPENTEPVAAGLGYQAEYRDTDPMSDAARDARNLRSLELNLSRCTAEAPAGSGAGFGADVELLSQGDLLDVEVETDDVFSGAFEVSRDGRLKLPHLSAVKAHGRAVEAVEAEIAAALKAQGYYRRTPQVSIRIREFGAARVFVAGAVFETGAHDLGGRRGAEPDRARQAALGAATETRNLTSALRAAGGVRPDADLSRVVVRRGGKEIVLDLRGAIDGRAHTDLMLIAGDEVEVASRGCFQEALMTPSVLSPPGAKVYLSNLTKPADANALAAIGKDARELQYGTRFLQAVVGMNCVGGTALTNADRYAVLFTSNPLTGKSIVIERRIEDLVRRADRDEFNPYLLPGDAIACYDSTVTNVVDIAKSISAVLGTGILLAL